MPNSEMGPFEVILKTGASLPMVRIERDKFLQKELIKYCSNDQVKDAIEYNPAHAGIEINLINKIAKNCINFETNKVSALSFAAGVPGGFAMIGSVPADAAQYFSHILRILQKLIYLYGWEELFDDNGDMDDETTNMLTLFVGVMFSVSGAAATITKISESAAQNASKELAMKALTKGVLYPIVKKIAKSLGIVMTKEIFAEGVSKIVPIIGGVLSGGLTYITYKPMAHRLKKHLSTLKWASCSNY